jgi:hypothetical protein
MEAMILQLVVQYGPEAVTVISNLVSKLEAGGTLTVADVQAEFAPLKPYSAYKIAVVPS